VTNRVAEFTADFLKSFDPRFRVEEILNLQTIIP